MRPIRNWQSFGKVDGCSESPSKNSNTNRPSLPLFWSFTNSIWREKEKNQIKYPQGYWCSWEEQQRKQRRRKKKHKLFQTFLLIKLVTHWHTGYYCWNSETEYRSMKCTNSGFAECIPRRRSHLRMFAKLVVLPWTDLYEEMFKRVLEPTAWRSQAGTLRRNV